MLKFEELPKNLQERMLEEQVLQGNTEDRNIFIKDTSACKAEGGFDWDRSDEGSFFWARVLKAEFD